MMHVMTAIIITNDMAGKKIANNSFILVPASLMISGVREDSNVELIVIVEPGISFITFKS